MRYLATQGQMAGQSSSTCTEPPLNECQPLDSNTVGCQYNQPNYSSYNSPYHHPSYTSMQLQYGYTPRYCYSLPHPNQGHTCSCCVNEWSSSSRLKYERVSDHLSNVRFESSAMYPCRGLLQTPYSVQDLRRKARMCIHSITNR